MVISVGCRLLVCPVIKTALYRGSVSRCPRIYRGGASPAEAVESVDFAEIAEVAGIGKYSVYCLVLNAHSECSLMRIFAIFATPPTEVKLNFAGQWMPC